VSKKKKRTRKRARKTYRLGEKFPDISLPKQEARCMAHLLRGKSAKGIARELDLSPRTVEYYINRIKKKLKCRTKFELVDTVLESDFQANFDWKLIN